MAKSGVMEDVLDMDDQPGWIVLTPSSDDDAWRNAIREAAVETGLRYREPDDGDGDPMVGDILLTDDARVAEANGASPLAVLMPRPDTSPEAVAAALDTFPPHSVWHASVLLAHALDQDRRVIVSGRTLDHMTSGTIGLSNGMKIRPPRAGDVELVRPAVRAAFALFAEGAPRPGLEAVWSERIFQYDLKASRDWEAAGQLDITGRPRILIYGPYLALPTGRWRITIRFAVDREAAKREFRVDWGTPMQFVSAHVHPREAGLYEIELEHEWTTAEKAEVRLVLMEGAFDGKLNFYGATVKYVDQPLLSVD